MGIIAIKIRGDFVSPIWRPILSANLFTEIIAVDSPSLGLHPIPLSKLLVSPQPYSLMLNSFRLAHCKNRLNQLLPLILSPTQMPDDVVGRVQLGNIS
jgi:hypothetical protein